MTFAVVAPADWVPLVAALTALLTAVAGLLKTFGVGHRVTDVGNAVGEVHTLVNQNLTDEKVRNEQLTASLTDAGVDVPPRPDPPPAPPTPALDKLDNTPAPPPFRLDDIPPIAGD